MGANGGCTDSPVLRGHTNLVSLTLSSQGTHDDEDVPILIDACDPNRSLTKNQSRRLITRLAGAFDTGSTVCVHLSNDILLPIIILAILASGCRWTGTMPVYKAPELEHHFRTAEVDYIITSEDLRDAVEAGLSSSGRRAEIILFEDIVDLGGPGKIGSRLEPMLDGTGLRSLRGLVRDQTADDLEVLLKAVHPDSPATLMQTSGTTGLPKMAKRTHRSHMTEIVSTEDNSANKPYPVRRLICTPLIHAFPFPQATFNSIRLGLPTLIMKRFDDTFAQTISDHQINEIFVAPALLLRLVNCPHFHPLVQSVRCIVYAGCSLTQSLRAQTLAAFVQPPRIVPVYGMTEGGWFATLEYPEDDDTGSVGRSIPGVEVKVSDASDTVLDVVDGRKVGEILTYGSQNTDGYLNNEESTRQAFTSDGWLRTGDIGYINQDGKIYLIDRVKDLIKVNGFQVAPAELETALARSPELLDSAVFGVGTDIDEHPLACVIRRHDDVTAASVVTHLRESLAGFKVSKCEVCFVEAIPRSPAGKILKNVLREQWRVTAK